MMSEINHTPDYWIEFLNHTFLIMILALSWCSVFWIKSKKRLWAAYFFFVGVYLHILKAYILPVYPKVAIQNLDTIPYIFAAGGRYIFPSLWFDIVLSCYVAIYGIWFIWDRMYFYLKNTKS